MVGLRRERRVARLLVAEGVGVHHARRRGARGVRHNCVGGVGRLGIEAEDEGEIRASVELDDGVKVPATRTRGIVCGNRAEVQSRATHPADMTHRACFWLVSQGR